MEVASETTSRPRGLRRAIDAIGRRLPRGWGDFLRQLALFIAFDIAYEATRGLSDGARSTAIRHAEDVVTAERSLGIFREQAIQHWAMNAPGFVLEIANWTYLQCQFTITFGFLLWVYLRRNDAWSFLRNTVIIGFSIGIVGYLSYPCAPPRLLPNSLGYGFVDTLQTGSASAQGGLVSALANPYAAMPSLHTATALLVGTSGVLLCRTMLAPSHLGPLPRARRVRDRGHREPLHPGRDRRRRRVHRGDERLAHGLVDPTGAPTR